MHNFFHIHFQLSLIPGVDACRLPPLLKIYVLIHAIMNFYYIRFFGRFMQMYIYCMTSLHFIVKKHEFDCTCAIMIRFSFCFAASACHYMKSQCFSIVMYGVNASIIKCARHSNRYTREFIDPVQRGWWMKLLYLPARIV